MRAEVISQALGTTLTTQETTTFFCNLSRIVDQKNREKVRKVMMRIFFLWYMKQNHRWLRTAPVPAARVLSPSSSPKAPSTPTSPRTRVRSGRCATTSTPTSPWRASVSPSTRLLLSVLEAQITLNRNGDLIYYMYAVIDLPGIVATEAGTPGAVGGQFPVFMDQSCAPCAKNDEAAIADYIDDGFTEASSGEKQAKLKAAKDRWLRDKYAQGPSLDCCDGVEDCPDNLCPELGGTWAHWTNGVGQFLIRCARIVVGGSTVDSLYNDFLFMWEELTGKSGRRLTEMIGKRYTRTQLICDSRQRRVLYVPLPFWFTQQRPGPRPRLAPVPRRAGPRRVRAPRALHRRLGRQRRGQELRHVVLPRAQRPVRVPRDHDVYLDNAERDHFATTHYEVLIVQNQAFHMQTTNSQVRMQLNFNHPVLELIWGVRRQCHEKCNNWFNYSGIDNRDPVVSAALYLNNQSRFSSKPGAWFRLVQPYQHHSNIPDCFISRVLLRTPSRRRISLRLVQHVAHRPRRPQPAAAGRPRQGAGDRHGVRAQLERSPLPRGPRWSCVRQLSVLRRQNQLPFLMILNRLQTVFFCRHEC